MKKENNNHVINYLAIYLPFSQAGVLHVQFIKLTEQEKVNKTTVFFLLLAPQSSLRLR
jgi:hypothetical protein